MGRKKSGYFRIIPKAGIRYLIKVKSIREGDKVKQEFLCHVGALDEVKKVICNECAYRTTQ